MQTKSITTQIRLSQWNQIIHERLDSGLTVAEYCSEHNLSKNAYYYWLRKIREAAIEASGIQFSELNMPIDNPVSSNSPVIVEFNDARICVSDPASRDVFSMVVEVLSHA